MLRRAERLSGLEAGNDQQGRADIRVSIGGLTVEAREAFPGIDRAIVPNGARLASGRADLAGAAESSPARSGRAKAADQRNISAQRTEIATERSIHHE